MSSSLRDQLVKAGLATSSQAKKAEKQNRAEQQNQRRQAAKKQPGESAKKAQTTAQASAQASAQERARRLKADKARRDKELARSRNDKYAQRALRAEIKQLLATHDQRKKVSDEEAVAYNFVHGKKIKRIYVNKAEREQLSSGRLIVINNDGNYHFVLPDIAARIEERDPRRIIVAHKEESKEKTADDEFYAKFEIPDDLDW